MEELGKLDKNSKPIMIEKDITIFLPNGGEDEYSTEKGLSDDKVRPIETIDLMGEHRQIVRITFDNENDEFNEYHNIPFLYSQRTIETN